MRGIFGRRFVFVHCSVLHPYLPKGKETGKIMTWGAQRRLLHGEEPLTFSERS